MKILIDIGHPAHVHFYKHPIRMWQEMGHRIVITSRRKEMATSLLDACGVKHTVLSTVNKGSIGGMLAEFIRRDLRLFCIVRHEKPDLLTGIGGIFAAHAGFLTRTPSIVFYDTENAALSNLITYPFSSLVVVPSCYTGRLPSWNLRYPGYHELSYLHPDRFKPDRLAAVKNGLDPERPTFLIRTVSWQASHDIHEKTWSADLLRKLVQLLQARGKVLISAERNLPQDLAPYQYTGSVGQIHHLMAHLALYVGESATMASECAVLGTPAIYAAQTGRGYTDEQESRYGLVRNLRQFDWPILQKTVSEMLAEPRQSWTKKKQKLLAEKIDVSAFVTDLINGYPSSKAAFINRFHRQPPSSNARITEIAARH